MMKNGTNIVKHATACHMSKAHSFKDDFTAALEGNVKKEIKRNVSKLAEKFGFDEDEAIKYLNKKLIFYSGNPNQQVMASMTSEETNDTAADSFNAGNVAISNPIKIQTMNDATGTEDTNGPADQEQYDEWYAQHQEDNKEKEAIKKVVDDFIKKLYDRNLVDDIEEAKKIGDEVLDTHNFEHSRYLVLKKMNVNDLKSILRGKDMKTSGRKTDLIQRIIAGPSAESGRKSCEAPFSELLMALALCNPNAQSYTDDNEFPECIITDALKKQYKEDMKTKTKEVLDKYFEDCRQIAHKLRDELNITATDVIKVFVQGKCITNPLILVLTQTIEERTQKKADLYLLVNGTRWIGISVKTTPGDTKSNWSIERLIGEQDSELKGIIKNIREEINKKNGIGRDWREYKSETNNKDYNRKIYNDSMYGNNTYKTQINTWMMKHENKSNLQNIIAKAAGSSNNFEMYECNGREYRDLRGIYCKIKNASEFRLLQDTPETRNYIEETLNRKSHYSNTAAKLWYYVLLNDTAAYRIEIRWKGDPFASPQLLLYDL